ncbi:FAS1 domain-containing protein [Cokeromyces recurvatus]|uniref:FAS1 domain-containing protein n=1 Tax=Cokeromyces recurvatus TaxID=90255 RepID=UPI00221F3D35|nr:FAS1 domain-containing protein [Cokeromyces recurvatus]KAI7902677.1 FAS1 domain-containing protein [Cokeromyces recurvatus]
MLRKLLYIFLLFISFFITFSHGADIFGQIKKHDSVWDILTTDKRFSLFINQIEENKLVDVFKDINANTLFAPTDKAIEEGLNEGILKRSKKMTVEQILYHLIPVSIKSNELWDGRLLETKAKVDEVQQRLRVTKTKDSLFVGVGGDEEQSKISQADIETSNGVIHVIDKVLSLPNYLDEVLFLNQDTKDFYDKCEKVHLTKELRHAVGNTIFVAKGDIFGDELNPFEKKYLLDHPEGKEDLTRLLNHQIATQVFFSDTFKEGKSKIKTVEGSEDLDILVENKKGAPSEITVNGVKVIQKDILASNGVIHVLEKPLLPKHKDNFLHLSTRKVLIGMNSTRFIKLFDDQGLGHYLDDDDVDDDAKITILAPPNESLDNNNEMILATKSWLKYHLIHGCYEPSDLQDGQLLETESHDDLGDSLYQRLDVHIIKSEPGGGQESILFGKSGVLGNPVSVNDKRLIYPIARPLTLPRDPLSRLPVNLELTTFVASLYASGSDKNITKARGVTLFAPSNDAFSRLGLLSKFLLQPESKDKLAQVVTYHAVQGLFYENSTTEGEHHERTLSSDKITLNKTQDGFFVRGYGALDGSDRDVIAKVIDRDILISNGVLHTIDRVQIPSSLEVTNRNLLTADNTNSFLSLLERTEFAKDVLDDLNSDRPYTILAPSDRAFAKLNLSNLKDKPDQLEMIAKLHILPVPLPRLANEEESKKPWMMMKDEKKGRWQDDEPKDISYIGTDFPTLLSHDDYVVITKNIGGGFTVRVKGTAEESADVIQVGRSSARGGVIEIDRVLIPKNADLPYHLSWWAIALIVLGVLLGIALLAVAAYLGWRWYQTRRQGRIALDQEEEH